MTAAGWVSGAKLVFQAKKRTGDYHGQMNFDNFHKWFVESLLPQIPAHSLIVMDNAPYHNVYAEGTPSPASSDLWPRRCPEIFANLCRRWAV